MRPLRAAGTAVAVGLAALALDLTVVTPRRLRVRDVPLAVPGWPAELDGLRVAVVGDVHVGSPWFGLERVRSIVQRVADAEPDLVLLLGDYMVDVTFGVHHDPRQVADALVGLRDVAPVVGVLGNHDWDADGVRVREAFEAAGLPILEESAVPVLDGRLWIAGVGDLWRRRPSVPQALASVPADATVVLLTHNPDVVLKVPPSVPLVLAGHTHGGQVRLLGRVLHTISKKTGNRWSHGWYPGDRLFVTPGLGTSKWPVRNVVPEVPVLVLRPA
jgi:predicted MPP superfamily phosphohydrolase